MNSIRTFAILAATLTASLAWGTVGSRPSMAQDAITAPAFSPLYQPPSRALNADGVPATGITGQVTSDQIRSIDGSQVTGTVAKALQSDQSTMAATAQALDPNAKLNLPVCNSDQVLTNNPVDGAHCVQVASGATGFANKAYLNTSGMQWTVPDGVYNMRLTAAAGSTLKSRPTWSVTGQSFAGFSTASCPVYSPGLGMGPPAGYHGVWSDGYWSIACPDGYTWNNNAVSCCSGLWDNGGTAQKALYTDTYGCQANNTNAAGSSGNKTLAVTPGQIISVSMTSQTVAVSGGPSQCPWSDTIYAVVTSAPTDNIHSDKSTGEQPGEASVSSVGILEW